MILLIIGFVICCIAYFIIFANNSVPSWRTIKLFNKLPGPTDEPFFIGPVFKLMKMELDDIIQWLQEKMEAHGNYFGFWIMGSPLLFVADPDLVEMILTSTKNIDKGPDYKMLEKWLNNGLLISSGEKWKQRRRMLTPSFHFKILDDNMDCMNRNWKKVVKAFLNSKDSVEPLPIMGRGALNIICETAMGTELSETDERSKEYEAAVQRTTENSIVRAMSPFLQNDLIFDMTAFGKKYNKDIKILHDFTDKVINERKISFEEEKKLQATEYSDNDGRKRQVFLDSLLELSSRENLSTIDIREEVDTFMFAGHDTTSTALQYLLMNLAENPEVQEEAYREQVEIFGLSDRDVTKDDLSKMHYLDKVIKESLRLHPPAPQISRSITEDIQMRNGLVIPAGTRISINIFHLHRNTQYWKDPEAFNPERFNLEESKNRHPYCYIPFSAGPRNCIGQKFAMLEMKIGASNILRSCKLSPVTTRDSLKYKMLVVLQPNTPIKVNVTPRN